MSDYEDEAVLLVGDRKIKVDAYLDADRSGPITGWDGYVEARDDSEDFHDAMSTDDVRIRLANGREGDVVPTNTSVGSARLYISGSGPIPFD